MRRYLDPYQDEPQNFGQFLGRGLQRVGAYLGEQQAAKQEGLLAAQERQDRLNLRADEAAYRDRVFGETQRHNLAMEQPKPEKAAVPYRPKDIEEALAYLTMNPGEDPTGALRKELTAFHMRLQKPEKAEKVDLPPNLLADTREGFNKEHTGWIDRRSAWYKTPGNYTGSTYDAQPNPATPFTEPEPTLSGYYNQNVRPMLPALGRKYIGAFGPNADDSLQRGLGIMPSAPTTDNRLLQAGAFKTRPVMTPPAASVLDLTAADLRNMKDEDLQALLDTL